MNKKLQIAGIKNMGKEIYLRIKVDKNTISLLRDFLLDIDHDNNTDLFYGKDSSDYKEFRDEWSFLESEINKFSGKIVFGGKYVHIFLEYKNYEKLNEILDIYFEFIKPVKLK